LLAFEPVGVASAIPPLVMMAHDRDHGVRKLDVLEYLGADHRVKLHLLELRGSELARLVKYVIGDGEFAYIMKQRARFERFDLDIR
jgi:hypothetical protein